jgi:hypothetical protein
MNRLLVCLVVALVSATALGAGAVVNLSSETPARVFFDNEEVGTTPMSIRDVKPGFHRLRLVDTGSGDIREYEFYSPESVTVIKDVNVNFAAGPATAPGPYAQPAPGPAVAPAAAEAAPQAASDQARSYEEGRRAERERQKVRTRNTLLGIGVANEIFNKGSSKKTVRGVSLGGALLNELFNR